MMDKKILIIDDDLYILELLETFLENHDHKVSTASTAEKGLAFARKTEYDLILLDIMLPDCNGEAVLNSLLAITPKTPVIMITGGSNIEIAKRCLEHGAVDYITKPFDFEYLYTTIIANMLGS
jgi:two-component system response regulator HydG